MPAVIDGTNNSTFPGVDGVTMLEGGVAMPRMVLSTAQNTTSGTSIDFTSIPSWVKKITVMLNGVSTNGTSNVQVQIGSGSIETTGYSGLSNVGTANNTSWTTGIAVTQSSAASASAALTGSLVLTLVGSNVWVANGNFAPVNIASANILTAGTKTTSGALDRLRLTTVNGTDTFDAGSVNILYEG